MKRSAPFVFTMFHGISRQRALCVAGHVVAVGLLLGAVTSRLEAEEKPQFTFVQWNDTHVEVASPPWFRLANEKVDYLVTSLNTGVPFALPDFVIGVGDMINGRTAHETPSDFALLKTKLARLKCPFYPVMGNHENNEHEGSPQFEKPYRATFGDDRVNYTFRKHGIEFIMLDDSGATASNHTAVGQARRNWLRKSLEASPNVPKIICCHIPFVCVREEAVLAKSYGYPDRAYSAHDDEMLQLVKEHSQEIIAVLSGHLHMTGVTQFDGIYQIVVSGTAGYPCDYAYYQVFHDRIQVRICSLPENLRTPDTNGNSKLRAPTDFVDATHTSGLAYVSGNASERAFCIPIRTAK
jgi:3',5'-cyclic AMP phosphodiesterase CpdA